MTDNFKRKPATNSILTVLTALDLLVVLIGVAAVPLSVMATGKIVFNPLYPMGVTNSQLIMSVPIFSVVMVITAWLAQASNKPKAAKMLAATPIFWGMAVFLMMLPSI